MLRAVVLAFLVNVALAGKAPTIDLNDGHKIPVVALGTGRGTAGSAPIDEVRDAVLWAIEAGYRHIDTATMYKDEEQVGQGIADAIGKGLVKREELFVTTKAPIDEVRDAVLWAIEAGYRHIDTAAVYEDEEHVGQGIADAIDKGLVKREELFVTTKLWNDKHARAQVVPALKESLKKLGLDYVDLYLIHFPVSTKSDGSADNIDYLETWQGMEEAKELGLARSIGVSNFNITQIDRLVANSKVKPAVNQIEVNPTLTQEPLVSHCQELGIAVMAYSPFGFLVSRKNRDAPPPRVDDPTLVKIAEKYGKNTAQIVLRYLVDRGLIPIPKSANKERIAQNIDLFDFELTKEEVAEISRFNKNVRVIHPKAWESYPYYPF